MVPGWCNVLSCFFPWVRSWFWSPCQTLTYWIICQRSWMDSSRSWVTTAKRFGKCEWRRKAGSCHRPGPLIAHTYPTPTDRRPQNKKFLLFFLAYVLPTMRS